MPCEGLSAKRGGAIAVSTLVERSSSVDSLVRNGGVLLLRGLFAHLVFRLLGGGRRFAYVRHLCKALALDGVSVVQARNLVDPASSHMLVSKIKPCMSQYKLLYGETANGSLKQL